MATETGGPNDFIWHNVTGLKIHPCVDSVGWLRSHNDSLLNPKEKVGFYGLDLYSLHKSIEAVIAFLDKADQLAAKEARMRYGCFDHFGEEVRRYGFSARLGLAKSCQDEAVKELIDLRQRHAELLRRNGPVAEEELFSAEQNALLVENAEHYYRAMLSGRNTAWNQRETHMRESLEVLARHLEKAAQPAKIVVWSHNLHVGDARTSDLATAGRISFGQLAREKWGRDAVLIGFTTGSGTVTAASNWRNSPPTCVPLKPALPNSYEAVFHQSNCRRFLLDLRQKNKATENLRTPRLERFLGVVYRADSARECDYFKVSLTDQFDIVIHIDETQAVEPLECTTEWDKGEVPETFPAGM